MGSLCYSTRTGDWVSEGLGWGNVNHQWGASWVGGRTVATLSEEVTRKSSSPRRS